MPRLVAIVLVLGALAAPAPADNWPLTTGMQLAVKQRAELSPARKEALYDTLAAGLLSVPRLETDKVAHATRDFEVYLSGLVLSSTLMTDEQFDVVRRRLEWALGNLTRLPALTAADRDRLVAVLAAGRAGARRFLAELGVLPDVLVERLGDALDRRLDAEWAPMVGNYFYPMFLYPGDPPTPEEVARKLRESPFLGDLAESYSGVVAAMGEGTFVPGGRDALLARFLASESERLLLALRGALQDGFDHARAAPAFQPPSEDLVEAERQVALALAQEAFHALQEPTPESPIAPPTLAEVPATPSEAASIPEPATPAVPSPVPRRPVLLLGLPLLAGGLLVVFILAIWSILSLRRARKP